MTFADALRALADLVAGGLSFRNALSQWFEHVDGPVHDRARVVAQLVELGATTDTAVAALGKGHDVRALAAILRTCASTGGSAARLVRQLADSIELREDRRRHAHAAAAAARASNGLLSGLPLVALPLLALSGVPIFDGLGFGLIACGGAIALAGMRWVERWTPDPPGDDISARAADLVAGLVRAGAGLSAALEGAARADPDRDLALAQAWVRLGRSWPSALADTPNEGLAALGRSIRRSCVTGTPVADSLERFAAARRLGQELTFERQTRAAPVRMVVPLVVCGLPGFCLMVVAPMLRSVPSV